MIDINILQNDNTKNYSQVTATIQDGNYISPPSLRSEKTITCSSSMNVGRELQMSDTI